MTTKATPNSNFHSLGGNDPHSSDDDRYQEYRTAWLQRPINFSPGNFPVHLDIEATTRCNLKCTFCDKLPFLSKEQMGDMNYDLYTQIIDEGMANGLYSIKLSYRGEPLLHPRLVDMVKYAKESGVIDVYFNTNGTLLTNQLAEDLIHAGLDRISVSVEGVDPTAFEKARVGASFERIKANLSNLIERRNAIQSPTPKVRVQTVRLPNLDLKAYAHYWDKYCDETAAIDFKDTDQSFNEVIAKDWACPQLWQRMTIEWNGVIHPCNNDDQGNIVVGKAGETSLSEIWKSRQVKRIRKSHQAGLSHEIEACAICPWRAAQIPV